MPPTPLFALAAGDVADIARGMRESPPVRLVALDGNWGPPVSGRFDADFLQVWAVAAARLNPKRVTLRGAREASPDAPWEIEVGLDRVSTEAGRDLFFAAVTGLHHFPTRFVVEMEAADGAVYHDNNGGHGVDYRLTPHCGRFATAVVGDGARTGPSAPGGAIWLLPGITPVGLVARSVRDEH